MILGESRCTKVANKIKFVYFVINKDMVQLCSVKVSNNDTIHIKMTTVQ